MLTIYRSNKAEWLAEILGQELRINPPEITEEVNIIVSTWPSSRWLSERISVINDINALVKYPFPGTYLKRLVKRVIGIDPNEYDPEVSHENASSQVIGSCPGLGLGLG